MQRAPRAPGEYYHLFNRGNNKQDVYLDDSDRARFLIALLLAQADAPLRFGRIVKRFLRTGVLPLTEDERSVLMKRPLVHVVSFALMPNHFHLIVVERMRDGIARYMQRLLNSYTKYFNTKRERSGHLFQGPFHVVHVEDDDQLLYLSAYVHRNPRNLLGWRGREHLYPWSSFMDYTSENRWGSLLKFDIVMQHFPRGGVAYQRFVERTRAKDRIMDAALLIDR